MKSAVTFLLCVFFCPSAALEQKIIKAEAGQDVTLRCRVPDNNKKNISNIEWNRPDLKPEYVLVYRDDQIYLDDQNPSFKNRVDLQDRRMKDGDVSLILKNVTTDDGGTYECRVIQEGTNRRKRDTMNKFKTISIISLSVSPSGNQAGRRGDGGRKDGGVNGNSRGHLGLVLPVVGMILAAAVVAAVGFLMSKRQKKKTSDPPPDAAAVQQLA